MGKKIVTKAGAVQFLATATVGRFDDGEDRYYNKLSRDVAQAFEKSKIPSDTKCTVDLLGLSIVAPNGNEVELFGVFMDTFRGRPWDCEKYCGQYYRSFRDKLEVAEEFLAQPQT